LVFNAGRYTILSWSLLILRLLLACLARFSVVAAMGAEVLRFPALVQNTVVVTVWWGVMVPFITMLKPKGERCEFIRWNLGFDLVHVSHVLHPLTHCGSSYHALAAFG
jgi:hypothetical protein